MRLEGIKMQMGDGKPNLFKCTYPNYVEGKINFCDQQCLAEGKPNSQIGKSTEQHFREFAQANLALMPDGNFQKAWFKKGSIRANGCYWNTSVLIIPIPNTPNYYYVGFFS